MASYNVCADCHKRYHRNALIIYVRKIEVRCRAFLKIVYILNNIQAEICSRGTVNKAVMTKVLSLLRHPSLLRFPFDLFCFVILVLGIAIHIAGELFFTIFWRLENLHDHDL